MFPHKTFALFCAVCALTLAASFQITRAAAGGEITGTVTDPKGAVIAGASVTVTDPISNQSFRAVTNEGGATK
jgi:hypothetical protein